MLVVYGIFCAYGFGILMNLSSWPFVLGIEVPGHSGSLSFVPGAPLAENLQPLRGLHAAHLDRWLGHRPGDHQLDRDRGARSGGPRDPAPGVPPGVVRPLGQDGPVSLPFEIPPTFAAIRRTG